MAQSIQRDHEADGRERFDFPIICDSCLGDNPYVRMTKGDYDKECKLCTSPFTVFRWLHGQDGRFKKTQVCHTCCKLKNVCQVCLLDLPVQVRDIRTHDSIPQSDLMKEFFAEEHNCKTRGVQNYFAKIQPNDTILKRQKKLPFHDWIKAPICSFYRRGVCIRGADCQYRHEMPKTGELSQQNIKGGYYVNDPAALKLLLDKVGEKRSLETPEDESIKTLVALTRESLSKTYEINSMPMEKLNPSESHNVKKKHKLN